MSTPEALYGQSTTPGMIRAAVIDPARIWPARIDSGANRAKGAAAA